jgi:O-antigen/teichoic acid export membrane protein
MQKPILARITPFLFLGIAIVAFLFSLVIMAYIFLFGAIVGIGLFVITWIRDKFFPTKKVTVTRPRRSGQTIDHDDLK